MSEVFKIQNISLSAVALIDFGLIIPPNEIVELENFDQTLLSPQLNTLLNDGTLVRLINDVSVPYSEAYTTTVQVYNFDSSTIDGSINKLFSQDITINASLGIRPLTTYVDGSLNIKVNQTLFDSSITSLTNKNTSQDASIILKADKTYVDASISVFATNASVGLALTPYATNASIGTAAFAKNASLGLYATNASIGLAGFINISSLNPYATNASVGLAIAPFATNASVNSALNAYATNASIGLAGFAKQTYVDASLNAKVKQTLFDSSIAFQSNWNISQEASLNNRVKKTGDTMTGDLILSGAGSFIRRDNSTNRVALYGGTGESDGAYFQVTGSGYAGSPYGRSAEFVIGELSQSQYTLYSYDGISTWTPRFTLIGSSGLVTINNDASIGGSLRVGNDSSLGRNLPYAQIDVSGGKKIVSAGNYYGQEFRSTFHTSTTTTTAVSPTYTSDTSIRNVNFPAGNYRITASYGMNKNVSNSDLMSRIQVDGVTLGGEHNHELSDTRTWLYTTRCLYTTLTEGLHTIDLQFSNEATGTLSMRDVYLEIIRVS